MPRTHQFDLETNTIFVEASGVFTDEEFCLGAQATVSDPRFNSAMRTLVDFTRVTQFQVTVGSLGAFVTRHAFAPAARRAFVVNSGFAKSFVEVGKMLGAVEQIKVFSDRNAAVAWLNEGVGAELQIA